MVRHVGPLGVVRPAAHVVLSCAIGLNRLALVNHVMCVKSGSDPVKPFSFLVHHADSC